MTKFIFLVFSFIQFIFSLKLRSAIEKNDLEMKTRICQAQDQCIFAFKKKTSLPKFNYHQAKALPMLQFDYKIILVFSYKLEIYEKDNSQVEIDKDVPLSQLIRTVYFHEISLDYGLDGNKLCFFDQFKKIFTDAVFPTDILQSENECLVIPILNLVNQQHPYTIILSCAENQKDLEEFVKVKDELSRIIDKFHISLFNYENEPAKNFPRKQGKFYFRNNGEIQEYNVKLFFDRLDGVTEDQSDRFSFDISNITQIQFAWPIDQAIEQQLFDKSEFQSFNADAGSGLGESCCFVIENSDGIFCSKQANCEMQAIQWSSQIRSFIQRWNINSMYKPIQKKIDKIECRSIELRPFVQRLKNTEKNQKSECQIQYETNPNYDEDECKEYGEFEVQNEKDMLATDSQLKSKLEHCINTNYDGILAGPMYNEFHDVLKKQELYE